MNLKARKYVEQDRKVAEGKLAARWQILKEKGLTPEAIQKDAKLRQIKALIRHADVRLTAIQAQEKLIQERARAKAEKIAAEKAARETPVKEVEKEAPPKKGKKERKEPAAKGEKPEKKKKEEKKE